MRAPNENTPALLKSVNLIWYPVSLVPIAALLYLGVTGTLPFFAAIIAIFFFFFWLFSLLFALYETFKRRKPGSFR